MTASRKVAFVRGVWLTAAAFWIAVIYLVEPMLAGAVAGPLATGVALAALWAVLESRTGTPRP